MKIETFDSNTARAIRDRARELSRIAVEAWELEQSMSPEKHINFNNYAEQLAQEINSGLRRYHGGA